MGNAAAIAHYAEVSAPCQAAPPPALGKKGRQPATHQGRARYAPTRVVTVGQSLFINFTFLTSRDLRNTSETLQL